MIFKNLTFFLLLFLYPATQTLGGEEILLMPTTVQNEGIMVSSPSEHACCDLLHEHTHQSKNHKDCSCMMMQPSTAILSEYTYIFQREKEAKKVDCKDELKTIHALSVIWQPPKLS